MSDSEKREILDLIGSRSFITYQSPETREHINRSLTEEIINDDEKYEHKKPNYLAGKMGSFTLSGELISCKGCENKGY